MSKLPQEIIDHICKYLPLEEAWYFSPYSSTKIYSSEIHDIKYWSNITDTNILRHFIENNILNENDRTSIFISACLDNKINITNILLEYGVIESKCCSDFLYIVQSNNYKAAKYLLENNIVYMKNDKFSIGAACGQNNINMVELLLKHGCDLTFSENIFAITWVADNGNLDMAKLLLKYGADPTVCENITIKKAKKNNYLDIVNLLQSHAINTE